MSIPTPQDKALAEIDDLASSIAWSFWQDTAVTAGNEKPRRGAPRAREGCNLLAARFCWYLAAYFFSGALSMLPPLATHLLKNLSFVLPRTAGATGCRIADPTRWESLEGFCTSSWVTKNPRDGAF